MTRTCNKCGESKSLIEYHRDRNTWRYTCKICSNQAIREYNRERDKTRYPTDEHSVMLRRKRQRKHYHANKYKIKASRIVEAAVINGELEREPCKVCNKPETVGHHPDYRKPMEVIWLCRGCHRSAHRKYDPIKV